MSLAARPLRFIVAVMALWAGGRTYAVWPGAVSDLGERLIFALPPLPDLARLLPASRPRTARPPVAEIVLDPPIPNLDMSEAIHLPVTPLTGMAPGGLDEGMLLAQARGTSPMLAMLFMGGSGGTGFGATPAEAPAALPRAGRLSGYGWFFQRGGGNPGLATDGQLGGGQAGVRLDYALTSRFAATARFSMPTGMSRGKEAAFGVSWQPDPAWPVRLTVERRVAVDGGGRNAFAAFVAGGVGPVDLPAGFRLDAYAQGGVVGARKRDAFVDGSATVTRNVTSLGDARLALGGGIWGAAQPGVHRLDIGPRARLGTTLGATQIGASLDWRQRVAGNAAPRSGIAFTLDGSF